MPTPTPAPSTVRRSATFATVVALLCLSLAGGLVPAAAAAVSDDDLQSELDRVEAEQARISQSLAEATARVDDLTARLAQIRDRSDELTEETRQLERRSARAHAQMESRVRAMYKGDRTSSVMAFATGGSLTEISRRTHYLTAMTRDDRRRFEVAAALAAATKARREELATVDQRLDELVAEAADAQTELDARFAAAGEAHDDLRTEIARREAEAERLAAEAEARRREAEEAARAEQAEEAARQLAAAEDAARRAAAASRSAQRAREEAAAAEQATGSTGESTGSTGGSSGGGSSGGGSSGGGSSGGSGGGGGGSGGGSSRGGGSGGKVCPQDNPRSFTDTWGAPRSGGRTHQGTDIFGRRGGDVFAIVSGRVEWTRTGSNSGLFLSLRGNDGHTYWYMHLQDFVARAGQRVQAGQLIAHNGDTGNARGTTPHIHFEYHPGGGGAVNPYPMLKSVCG